METLQQLAQRLSSKDIQVLARLVQAKENPVINTEFKVVSISSNTNSFGLQGVIIVSKEGKAFQIGCNTSYNQIKKNDILQGSYEGDRLGRIMGVNYEIPEILESPNAEVLKEIWSN